MREIRQECVSEEYFCGAGIALRLQMGSSAESEASSDTFPGQFENVPLLPGVTELLRFWNRKEPNVHDGVLRAVYSELHNLAHRFMSREAPGHTLQTTALVHEAYLRLRDSQQSRWDGRAHFLGAFAQAMRRVLIDWARARQSEKRGSNVRHHSLEEAGAEVSQSGQQLLEVDEALDALASVDARKARVVELRFFGGFSLDEAADALHISRETAARDWRLARSWLHARLSSAK
jgi:RNA polymerase sigma-70 factor (ECF subfamily)